MPIFQKTVAPPLAETPASSGGASSEIAETSQRVLSRIWRKLSPRRKKQLVFLMGLLLLGMIFEAFTVASVVPVVSVLAQPADAMSMPVLQPLIALFGVETTEELRATVALTFFLFIIVSAAVRLFYLYASIRLSAGIGLDFAALSFRRTLNLPYSEQVTFRSNYFLSSVQKIEMITSRCIMPILMVFGAFITALTIAITLFVVEPTTTISLIVTIAVVLVSLVVVFRGPLRRLGRQQASTHPIFIGKLQTARGGIREIILDGAQDYFAHDLTRTLTRLRNIGIKIHFLTSAPRYFIETIFIIVLVGIAYMVLSSGEDVASALPTLSLIAVGALKILPATQTIAIHWATLRSSIANISDALELVEGGAPEAYERAPHPPLVLRDSIKINNVSYRYADDQPWILKGVNLDIAKGEKIGIIGSTGSGKSTLIDIIMGLLPPTQGGLQVDGIVLDDDMRRGWRKSIAHVPQSIFLMDASVAENIGFGVPKDQISRKQVISAAQNADLASFVEDGDDGFNMIVGERGNQISGGQRQRIGIARALYKNANVIVLDEATSALDGATEERIMQTLLRIGQDTTIIMIAHRLTTLKDCDRIVEIDNGQITRICRYTDLSEI